LRVLIRDTSHNWRIQVYLAKYRRAQEHLNELHTSVDHYMQTQVHRVDTLLDFDPGEEIGYARTTSSAIDFHRGAAWGLIVGDDSTTCARR
jgi:hypothetical protein